MNIKKLSIFIITLLGISYITEAQIKYEPGYFIDNEGTRITCLIKNVGWSNNPEKFIYVISENDEESTKYISEVQAFGIDNGVLFKRFNVAVDLSTNKLNDLDESPQPKYTPKTLFLKELVRGEFNLYGYKGIEITKYFYATPNSEVSQLVYKKYKKGGSVATNKQYLTQLFLDVNCDKEPVNKIEKVKYIQTDLVAYFINQNKCINSNYFSLYEKGKQSDKKRGTNINVRGGALVSFLKVDHSSSAFDADFGLFSGSRIGVEFEFNTTPGVKLWTIVLEPAFERFDIETNISRPNGASADEAFALNSSFNLHTSFRRYLYLNNSSGFFVNLGFVGSLPFNSSVELEGVREFEVNPSLRFSLGLGFSYKNKFSIEYRQISPIDWSDSIAFNVKYDGGFITLGYNIFQTKDSR